jgi:hypothetical protein
LRVLFYEYRFTPNATIVDDAIRFVSQKPQQGFESMHNSTEESKEPNYDEDQLEEKQEEKETGEANQITINQVF